MMSRAELGETDSQWVVLEDLNDLNSLENGKTFRTYIVGFK